MNSHFIIVFLVFFVGLSIGEEDWSDFEGADIYRILDKTDCKFPFKYGGKSYEDCTIADGNNGDIPWCSLTEEYQGLITYCYNFQNTTLQCRPSFTMPDNKTYVSCDYLSKGALFKQCRTNSDAIKYRYCTDALSNPSRKSVQRKADCAKVYTDLAKDHTMCYGPSKYAVEYPLNSSQIQDILDMHNDYRSEVDAKVMFKLHWDDELAKMAQAHSNLCVFEHDLAKNRLIPKYGWKNGQNIVMSSEFRSSPASLIDMMLGSEKPNFRYGDTCYPGENTCLHYTQAMLSNITHVGCGQTNCVYPDRVERYLTCNYILSQYSDNYNIPYEPSDIPGSGCPDKLDGKLCDCSVICNYKDGVNEILDPNTCTCKTSSGKRSIEEIDPVLAELEKYENPSAAVKSVNKETKTKRRIRSFKLADKSKRSKTEEKRHIKHLKVVDKTN